MCCLPMVISADGIKLNGVAPSVWSVWYSFLAMIQLPRYSCAPASYGTSNHVCAGPFGRTVIRRAILTPCRGLSPSKIDPLQLGLMRIFEERRGRGYEGGYDAVRRYARRWSKERGHSTAAAFVPLSFAPGEAYQFDWSHEVVLLSGVTVIVKAAHVRLCHSRMLFVRVYPRETQEMVFDAHDRAFALVKGA